MSKDDEVATMAENLTPTEKKFYKDHPEITDPLQRRSLEKLVTKWDTLKTLDERHNVERLRLRADIAEGIRDTRTTGLNNETIGARLGINHQRVSRLVLGNYNFGPSSVHRKGKPESRIPLLTYNNDEQRLVLAWIAQQDATGSIPHHMKKAKRGPACRYCGAEAAFKVEIPNRSDFFVCEFHKPPVG